MDERTLRRATEPFFTTKGIGKGTGLGLSMVHGLAEQSGGTLILKSKPGVGTTAELWLPAADPGSIAALPAAALVPEPVNEQFIGPLSVLVVDDDPLVLSNTGAMLEDLGHSVTTAASGDAALRELRTRRFDLLLTDHAMPSMTGAQLIREIGNAYPDMGVIIATGFAELPEDASVITRLRKPYSQNDLAEALGGAGEGAGSMGRVSIVPTARKRPRIWPNDKGDTTRLAHITPSMRFIKSHPHLCASAFLKSWNAAPRS